MAATDELGGYANREELDRLAPGKTTAEIVADIVESDPAKHGVTLEERLRRARARAGSGDEAAWEAFYRARIEEIGGDPDEMMAGNKPRYTVDEETGAVKDHELGLIHLHSDAEMKEQRFMFGEETGDVKDHETGDTYHAHSVLAPEAASQNSEQHGQSEEPIPPAPAAPEDYTQPVVTEEGRAAAVKLFGAHMMKLAGPNAVELREQAHEILFALNAMDCDHAWPADHVETSTCSKCGLTFGEWAAS